MQSELERDDHLWPGLGWGWLHDGDGFRWIELCIDIEWGAYTTGIQRIEYRTRDTRVSFPFSGLFWWFNSIPLTIPSLILTEPRLTDTPTTLFKLPSHPLTITADSYTQNQPRIPAEDVIRRELSSSSRPNENTGLSSTTNFNFTFMRVSWPMCNHRHSSLVRNTRVYALSIPDTITNLQGKLTNKINTLSRLLQCPRLTQTLKCITRSRRCTVMAVAGWRC